MSKLLVILQRQNTLNWFLQTIQELGYDEGALIYCRSLEDCYGIKADGIKLIVIGADQIDNHNSGWLDLLTNHFAEIPFIVADEEINADRAMHSLKQGARDYIVMGSADTERVQEALNNAENKVFSAEYRRMFNETPTPMYIFDCKTYQFLAANEAALKQYGFTREEFLQLKATDIRPETELERFYLFTKSLPDTYLDAGRFLHKRKNGELFYVHIYSHRTFFEGREASLVLIVDIDQRVKTERALRETTEDMVDILENITDAFYALDKDWKFTYVNKQFERIQNKDRSEFIGKRIWDVFPDGKDLKFFEKYTEALTEQSSVHFEQYIALDKVWVNVNAYPTRNGLAVYFRDITEQKQIQEKIINDEQNLRAIINNTADIIWSVDHDLNIKIANRQFWKRIKDLTGKQPENFSPNDLNQEVINIYRGFYERAFKNEAFKLIMESPFYEGRVEELSFNPICNRREEVIGVNCFIRDVTEEYEYQQKIKKQNEHLREIAWLQSHKARMPVANLLGLLQLLDSHEHKDINDHEIMNMIRQTTNELDEVIRDITNRINNLDAD